MSNDEASSEIVSQSEEIPAAPILIPGLEAIVQTLATALRQTRQSSILETLYEIGVSSSGEGLTMTQLRPITGWNK